jgi:nucleoside-diphosphate-sugar epimerase
LYFASGVSNSLETRESEYEREIYLMLDTNTEKRLVYFSSLCVFYANTRYAKHKIEMEGLVKDHFENYCILRLGTITWGTNPHLLINYFQHKFEDGEEVEIQDVYRYVLEKDEFLHWVNLIPDFNCEINIPGKMMKVSEIVEEYV